MGFEDHILELLPEYVLDLLEEQEQKRVAAHLRDCAACQVELNAYKKLTAQLTLAAPEVPPPPGLKRRIFARLEVPVQRTEPASLNWLQRVFGGKLQLSPALVLASLVVVAFLAASNLFLWRRIGQIERASQPQWIQIAMAPTDKAPGASGTLVISPDDLHGTLVVNGLPAVDASHAYQLWLIQDGQRTSGGVFSVSQDGYAALIVDSEMPLSGFDAFGVTVEPAGGSPGPTGDKVLGGENKG